MVALPLGLYIIVQLFIYFFASLAHDLFIYFCISGSLFIIYFCFNFSFISSEILQRIFFITRHRQQNNTVAFAMSHWVIFNTCILNCFIESFFFFLSFYFILSIFASSVHLMFNLFRTRSEILTYYYPFPRI